MPGPRVIRIHCQKCKAPLFKYRKDSPGHLIKIYKHAIIERHAVEDKRCGTCGQEFARKTTLIHGSPANKIIQGKVFVK